MAQKRSIGAVTGAAASGGGLGSALALILIHFVPSLEPISGPVTFVITVALTLVGGYLSPPKKAESVTVVTQVAEDPFADVDDEADPFAGVPLEDVPDGTADFARHEHE